MKTFTPEEATQAIGQGALVIDVRTTDEFADGHIHGAQNINISDPLFGERVRALDKEATYVVNCQSGGRSSRAVSLMNELGFKNAHNLTGGIIAWKNAGFPVDQ